MARCRCNLPAKWQDTGFAAAADGWDDGAGSEDELRVRRVKVPKRIT
jgi:hypothetical protein